MNTTTETYVLLRAFVEELTLCGMQAACTSPGSRSAPLVLTLANEPRLRCYSHIDERCSGFFALGLAKATERPVAVACTSGTAVAELLPAAVEAREARVPLILLTADRPAELRENGAGQAIDQLKIFGSAAKWFFEVELPSVEDASLRWMRTLACRAYATTIEGSPGVVHLNFPLREPLVSDEALPPDETARADGRAYVARPARIEAGAPPELLALARGASRGVIVAGRHERDTKLAHAAPRLAQATGWPLLADPMSGARRGPAAIAHYDSILRAQPPSERPELVLRVGDLPVSRPLREWLSTLTETTQIAIDPEGAWQDPAGVLGHSFACEPAAALDALAEDASVGDPDWLASWRALDEQAAGAITSTLAAEGLSEPRVAAELGTLLPEDATLFVASSMPVRDIETFWSARADPPRVLCNRGANGIDGTISSAFGAAAAEQGHVVLLIGDVALAYDVGGLLAAKRLGLELTIVLLDNGGGGIFDFLPVAQAPMARVSGAAGEDVFTGHVSTPTGLDFAQAAELYGLGHELVEDVQGFREALERAFASTNSAIVEVRGDRSENMRAHRRISESVARALSLPAAAAEPPA